MIKVTKRDGRQEEINLDKIHKIVAWACEGLSGVSESEIELRAQLQFEDGIRTKDIHEMLIKSASELISIRSPDYQYVAARLLSYQIRKEVYGDYEPWELIDIVRHNVGAGKYTAELLTNYSKAEWEELENYIDHDRDNLIAYAGMEQWRGKYLVKNRVTEKFYETPQVAYMLIAAIGFMAYPKAYRLEYVKSFYDAISLFQLSLPTPIMAGLRTPVKQFSSCVTIRCDDSLDSIKATGDAIISYISRKAGIGIDAAGIRSIKSEIRGGDAEHTGKVPFLRKFQSDTKSCSQGGVRGGAATVHLAFWDYEFEELVVLKNNKGTEFNRVRHLDYSFLLNRVMYQRLLEGGDISFFSPNEVPGLLEAFYVDTDKFEELYVKYEKDTSIRRRTLSAYDAFRMLHTEAMNTGRIYIMNIDHANSHGSFIPERAPITQSNLCQEITLPTVGLKYEMDENGRIALCTLAAGNWPAFATKEDMKWAAQLIVRFLDELLDYQDYPMPAAELATKEFRPLGIGIVNFAYFLAKNGVGYDPTAYDLVDEWMEAWSYYLLEASVDLAEEKGPCPRWEDTKYSLGILPIDTYKRDVDSLVAPEERMPWQALRERMLKFGIRNATLMAQMPAETSAQAGNLTNGISAAIAPITEKVSKDGVLKQVLPEVRSLNSKYDYQFDQEGPQDFIKLMAIIMKYMDQSMSLDFSYNLDHYENRKVPMETLIGDTLTAYKYGMKNRYYINTNDGQGEEESSEPLEDIEFDDCGDACKL